MKVTYNTGHISDPNQDCDNLAVTRDNIILMINNILNRFIYIHHRIVTIRNSIKCYIPLKFNLMLIISVTQYNM